MLAFHCSARLIISEWEPYNGGQKSQDIGEGSGDCPVLNVHFWDAKSIKILGVLATNYATH